jgi:hypothetical protein
VDQLSKEARDEQAEGEAGEAAEELGEITGAAGERAAEDSEEDREEEEREGGGHQGGAAQARGVVFVLSRAVVGRAGAATGATQRASVRRGHLAESRAGLTAARDRGGGSVSAAGDVTPSAGRFALLCHVCGASSREARAGFREMRLRNLREDGETKEGAPAAQNDSASRTAPADGAGAKIDRGESPPSHRAE